MPDHVRQPRQTTAELIAGYLRSRGVERVYGLCGGHIQPIWDALAVLGIRIVDVRHECAAVYMAHAEAELTGRPGVALVTAGPGLTNAVTGVANASTARAPVLLLSGRPPRPQAGRGALQELPQRAIVGPLCRAALTADRVREVLPRLDEAMLAAVGLSAPPGPVYLDFPADLLTEPVRPADIADWTPAPVEAPQLLPDPARLARAAAMIGAARRPVVIAGREAREAATELAGLLESARIPYLDSGESRGVLPPGHPSVVTAVRGRAMREADLIITLDRSLNFQLAYGSAAAAFNPAGKFLRVARYASQLSDNRRGDVEVQCSVLAFVTALAGTLRLPDLDDGWVDSLRAAHLAAAQWLAGRAAAMPPGADGLMHPYRLLDAVSRHLAPDAAVVADGGDILSFARVALQARTFLDCGSLGCLGVGVPFANAAALLAPGRQVVAVIGDGSFGFTAMEIDTAVRHGLAPVYVIANNQAWNIEKTDQRQRFGGRAVGTDLPGCRYDRLAVALGAAGRRVSDPDELPAALAWAQDHAPAVLDVRVTQDAQSPDSLSGLAAVPPDQALAKWQLAEERRGSPGTH
jgi:thiamine pyrophosphate-dependent acetolactate synthase large subunit-like protein